MSATKKLYESIAKRYAGLLTGLDEEEPSEYERRRGIATAINALAVELAEDNLHFDRGRFFEACGLNCFGQLPEDDGYSLSYTPYADVDTYVGPASYRFANGRDGFDG